TEHLRRQQNDTFNNLELQLWVRSKQEAPDNLLLSTPYQSLSLLNSTCHFTPIRLPSVHLAHHGIPLSSSWWLKMSWEMHRSWRKCLRQNAEHNLDSGERAG